MEEQFKAYVNLVKQYREFEAKLESEYYTYYEKKSMRIHCDDLAKKIDSFQFPWIKPDGKQSSLFN